MIEEKLFLLQDLQYRDFQCRLMPTVDASAVIGVRTPMVRALAKEIEHLPETEAFLRTLPHKYYEENNLHAFLIERIKDYEAAITAIDEFLPYVDNWATCDSMSPKVLKKHPEELFCKIKEWIKSSHTYTRRFAIEMLMSIYLDDNFDEKYVALVSKVRSDEYYVNMMVAWYFATALAKHYESVLPYIEQKKLDIWTHNKAIQKALESYRITEEQKAYLKGLKIK